MRVLLDTNVFISYLLSPSYTSLIRGIFEAWSEGKFTLLVPEALLDEILVTVTSKARLSTRISPEVLKELLATVRAYAEEIPAIEEPIPPVTRDPKDDYLLAYAVVGRAEYLVTGDNDLLELSGQIPDLHILSPRQFHDLLH